MDNMTTKEHVCVLINPSWWTIEIWISYNFPVPRNSLLLFLFKTPLKAYKPLLADGRQRSRWWARPGLQPGAVPLTLSRMTFPTTAEGSQLELRIRAPASVSATGVRIRTSNLSPDSAAPVFLSHQTVICGCENTSRTLCLSTLFCQKNSSL